MIHNHTNKNNYVQLLKELYETIVIRQIYVQDKNEQFYFLATSDSIAFWVRVLRPDTECLMCNYIEMFVLTYFLHI